MVETINESNVNCGDIFFFFDLDTCPPGIGWRPTNFIWPLSRHQTVMIFGHCSRVYINIKGIQGKTLP